MVGIEVSKVEVRLSVVVSIVVAAVVLTVTAVLGLDRVIERKVNLAVDSKIEVIKSSLDTMVQDQREMARDLKALGQLVAALGARR